MWKVNNQYWSTWHEYGTQKKSESLTGIEPMTWAMRNHRVQDNLTEFIYMYMTGILHTVRNFSLLHPCVMLINSPFMFNYQAKNSITVFDNLSILKNYFWTSSLGNFIDWFILKCLFVILSILTKLSGRFNCSKYIDMLCARFKRKQARGTSRMSWKIYLAV